MSTAAKIIQKLHVRTTSSTGAKGLLLKQPSLSALKAWVGLGQPGSARATNYCYACHN